MQLVVDDLLTEYTRAGKGSVVVLLHGWGDSSVTFEALGRQLQKRFTVIALDLPGFGKTQIPPDVWDLDDYAAFVCDFLAKLEAKPHAFVAHSNGGAVAIRGLAQGTLRADRLVLLAASGIRNRQKLRRLILKIIAKVGKALTFWLPSRYKRALQKMLYGAAGSDMLVAPHLQETFRRTVRQDVQRDAAKLQLPTLLVYGEHDRATPPLYGRAYARLIPRSELHIVKDAEHFVHHDQPEQVAALLEKFL